MTPQRLSELRELLLKRYAVVPPPGKCRVCGAPMALGSAGNDGLKWHCSSEGAKGYGKDRAGQLEALEHWQRSEVIQARTGDPQVIEFINLVTMGG